jgi:hypothetical protein
MLYLTQKCNTEVTSRTNYHPAKKMRVFELRGRIFGHLATLPHKRAGRRSTAHVFTLPNLGGRVIHHGG